MIFLKNRFSKKDIYNFTEEEKDILEAFVKCKIPDFIRDGDTIDKYALSFDPMMYLDEFCMTCMALLDGGKVDLNVVEFGIDLFSSEYRKFLIDTLANAEDSHLIVYLSLNLAVIEVFKRIKSSQK